MSKKKFEQLVHYILWYYKHKHGSRNFGSVKLNKILWILDVYQYCRSGHSMSGEKFYIKRKYGPVPPHILATIESLDTKNLLEVKGYTEKGRIDIGTARVKEPDNIHSLDEQELKLVEKFCNKLAEMSGKQLSEYSHDEVYELYEMGERIPLAAYLVSRQIKPTKRHIDWAKRHIA